ncbi:MAG: zinc ribbon domain-containing protein [Carboxylicivirga sp.]|jgi:hypothetical protein|nr:zinc ribbon domain-containing protein [Carboxylicivirga sp.]MCT4646521.1 zinc ribbon domain-containing protein [Carboxylicivirga sp.]
MIIYGWRASHIKSEANNRIICPSCGETGTIVNSVFGRYVHIFWIPVIPIGKTGGAQCTHCQKTFSKKEMNDDMKRAYKTMKGDTRIPFWHFSGIFVIGLIIGLVSFSNNAEAKAEKEYIEAPLAGDVYEYENGPSRYSTIKVLEVSEDSIYFLQNNYDFTSKSGIEEIDVDSCYADDIYMMSRSELLDLYTEGTIFDINRK